jgi:hypothetical protein
MDFCCEELLSHYDGRACPAMLVITGLVLALGGALAAIAGLTDMRRMRRLRRSGVKEWATVVHPAAQPPRRGDDLGPLPAMLRYSIADGRVAEQVFPRSGEADTLDRDQKILVWYDPADPSDVLVYRRHGDRASVVFLAAGCALVAAGLAIAALGH